jgi:hypothetical protein
MWTIIKVKYGGHMNLFDKRMIRPLRPNNDGDDDELTAELAGDPCNFKILLHWCQPC